MNKTLKLAGAFLALALVTSAQAASIAGRIDIGAYGSTLTIDKTANTVVFNEGVGFGAVNAQVTFGNGDYSAFNPAPMMAPTAAIYSDFNYSLPFAPVGLKLWELALDAGTYFLLNSLSSVVETTNGLVLQGLGSAYLTGFDMTEGLWSFSADRNSGETLFSFSSTTQVPPPSVPESGASIALLGSALVAMGLISRRRRA